MRPYLSPLQSAVLRNRLGSGIDAPRRRPVSGGSGDRRAVLWVVPLTALTLLVISAVAIDRLQQYATQRSELRVQMTAMEVAAWQQDALRSRAVMAHGLTHSAAQQRREIDDVVDALGRRFQQQDPGSAHADAVQAAFVSYDTAVDHEFALLADGDVAGAQHVDEWQADPAFGALAAALNDADRYYQRLADQAATRARLGTTLILAVAASIVIGLVWQSRKIRLRAYQRIAYQSSHDTLTGLPNRARLLEHFAASGSAPGQVQAGAALLLIDLDRFKEINETLGHHYGDQLLIQVAQRIRDSVRGDEVVARLGGDEFAVCLPGITDEQDVAAVAMRLHAALEQPFPLDGLSLTVTGSIGAALCPDHGKTGEELLQRADIAMYTAKATHTGYLLFDAVQHRTEPHKLTLASELRRGLDDDQLLLHYQPKIHAHTGEVLGAEALVRWQHPQNGLIPPDDFVPLAEHTGLISHLTQFVLDAALQQCRAWQSAGQELTVAVNISTHRLLDLKFPDEVNDLLNRWRVPARLLTLEITESAIMADPDRALRVVEDLHTLGVKLSIDDFGTGYSSLAYLKALPVHELKIDRSFVSCMTTSERDAVIVRSTIELGRNLGLHVVAEGVEDQTTWRQLDAFGCHAIQGYYVSRPIPSTAFNKWLTQRRVTVATLMQ